MPGLVPPAGTELDTLLAYLGQQRGAVTLAAHGLEEAGARATPTAGPLSVGGLVKHLAAVERFWMSVATDSVATGAFDGSASQAEYDDGFRLGPDDSLAAVLADYELAAKETDETVRAIGDLDRAVAVPAGVPWFPEDVAAWSMRWIVLHLIEETARHAGHADIVREGVDGATAMALMAAAEGWPATPWITPWEPAG